MFKSNELTLGRSSMDQPGGTGYVYNNTVYDSRRVTACNANAGTMIATNNVSMKPGGGFFDFKVGTGTLTQSHNVSSDATPPEPSSQINKTAYATYFRNTTAGTEDLHLRNDSLSLWGSNGANLSADPNLPVTDDIDGAPRIRPDIGADELGVCCGLTVTEAATTLTVTGANQFELRFNAATGGGIDRFFDLAEDAGRTTDLVGAAAQQVLLFDDELTDSGGNRYYPGRNPTARCPCWRRRRRASRSARMPIFTSRAAPWVSWPACRGLGTTRSIPPGSWRLAGTGRRPRPSTTWKSSSTSRPTTRPRRHSAPGRATASREGSAPSSREPTISCCSRARCRSPAPISSRS